MVEGNEKIHSTVKSLLSKSKGWIMISQELMEIFKERYKLKPLLFHIVHNPVKLTPEILIPNKVLNFNNKELIIAYAGSIWGMHLDAIINVAEAVYSLRAKGILIQFILYTTQGFFDTHKDVWSKFGVVYGGHKTYPDILQFLKSADLLLVVSSFLPQFENHSRSSLQTKVTDYMACGKPVFSVGPKYSICNKFVSKWKIGKVCDSNHKMDLMESITDVIQNRDLYKEKGVAGLEVLKLHFEQGIVTEKLYRFLQEVKETK